MKKVKIDNKEYYIDENKLMLIDTKDKTNIKQFNKLRDMIQYLYLFSANPCGTKRRQIIHIAETYKKKGYVWSPELKRYVPPNPTKPIVIYDKVLEIYAQKGINSNYPKQKFVHKFKTPVIMLGLPDGSILLKSKLGKRIWEYRKIKGGD